MELSYRRSMAEKLYRCTCGFETEEFDLMPGHSATINSDSNHDYREAVRIHDDEFYRMPGYRSPPGR